MKTQFSNSEGQTWGCLKQYITGLRAEILILVKNDTHVQHSKLYKITMRDELASRYLVFQNCCSIRYVNIEFKMYIFSSSVHSCPAQSYGSNACFSH